MVDCTCVTPVAEAPPETDSDPAIVLGLAIVPVDSVCPHFLWRRFEARPGELLRLGTLQGLGLRGKADLQSAAVLRCREMKSHVQNCLPKFPARLEWFPCRNP